MAWMSPSADRYERLEVIGSGGMATVWRARDTLLDRVVAMKRPHPAPPDSEMYARFERESRMAATVSHPNLVTVFDVGADEIGPYLIMEFIDAPSLAASAVGPDGAALIGSQIAAAVAELHAVGIVHRDIKPANVLMAPGGAKLTDFGIARSLDSVDVLTQTGVVHATPAYAAPEVLARGDYSPAADVYSLGALLLELVTGEPATSRQGTRVMVTDSAWSQILGPTLSETPADRPSSADLALQLAALSVRPGTAMLPPTTRLAVGDLPVTTVMDATDDALGSGQRVPVPRSAEPARQRSRRVVWAFGALALVVLVVIVIAARRSPGDIVASTSTAPTSAASAVTLSPESTPPLQAKVPVDSAPVQVVPPDTVPPPTLAPESSSIAVARGEFLDFVEGLAPSEIKNKEVRDLSTKLDEAIAAAAAGDTAKAVDKLSDVVNGVDKHIESDADREAAFVLLAAVYDSLGLDTDDLLDGQFPGGPD
jgi:serine/threonine protein kinase